MTLRSLFVTFCLLASVLGLQAQWNPTELEGLILWVRADSSVVTDGSNKVQQWLDMSPAGNDLSEVAPNYQPLLVEDVLNGHAGIRFDGSNDNLEFTELTTIRSVFWVVRESEEATYNYRSLLGDNDSYHFLRGEDGAIWNAQFTDPAIQEGSTRIGFEEIDGVSTAFPGGFQVVSLRTTGPVTASRFNRDRFYIDRAWNGEVMELLILDEALDSSQTVQVENYLADYYTESLSLGPDILIEENFCDTILSVDPSFQVIQWSTGATSQEIAVNQSASYWVEALDVFGRVHVDSTQVQFPGNLDFPEELILCEGADVEFDTGLNEGDYSFLWSTGEDTPQITVNDAQVISVSIEDAYGCTVAPSPTEVVIDYFASEASLQPGEQLCVGNSIFLDPLGSNVETYTWMDGSDAPSFTVVGSGVVGLTAMNENGCVYAGSLDVTVVGAAPELDWIPNQPWCAESELTLEAEVLNGEEVQNWAWQVNGTSFTGNPLVIPALDAGAVNVDVEAVTEAGCVTTESADLEVFALPELLLQHDLLCAGSPLTLWVSNETPDLELADITWTFAGQSATGDTVEFEGVEPGFWSVAIMPVSADGCGTNTSAFVDVQPAPEVGFLASGQCLGQLTVFDAEIETNGAGNAANYNWDFGDNTSSSLPSPSHLYAAPGLYEVSLKVFTTNGCADSTSAPVSIVPLPEADFALGNACLGQAFQMEDLSVSDQDAIESWHWEVQGAGEFTEQHPVIYFDSEGFQEVVLTVETTLGCTDSKLAQIPVFAVPQPMFEMDPPVGSAPLEVTFNNLTEGAASYFWDFGNGLSAEEDAPVATFDTDGLYTIELTATNQYGCSVSIENTLLVDDPVLDLEMVEVETESTENGLLVSAIAVNRGNFAVSDVAMRLNLPGNGSITEIRQENWEPGEFVLFYWQAFLDTGADDRYICASVHAESELAEEATPLNNTRCTALGSLDLEVADVFPNPASGQVYLRVISPRTDKVQVELVNAMGQRVMDELYALTAGFNQLELDISSLNAGTYTLRVFNEYEEMVRQVVVY